jgi:hypothetical protein
LGGCGWQLDTTCPLDRTPFSEVAVLDGVGGPVLRRFPVAPRRQYHRGGDEVVDDDDDDDDDPNHTCQVRAAAAAAAHPPRVAVAH